MTKALIGVLIGGAAAVVAAYVIKKKEKKYAEVQSSEKEEVEEDDEKETSEIKEKISSAAKKIVEWVLTHKDEIEAATAVLGLASACLNFKNKVVEGRKAVDKTLKRNELKGTKNDLGNMTADQALEHVKKTKGNLLLVDSDNFGYVISPEVAA